VCPGVARTYGATGPGSTSLMGFKARKMGISWSLIGFHGNFMGILWEFMG